MLALRRRGLLAPARSSAAAPGAEEAAAAEVLLPGTAQPLAALGEDEDDFEEAVVSLAAEVGERSAEAAQVRAQLLLAGGLRRQFTAADGAVVLQFEVGLA